jgi:hypothetical protein
MNNAPQSPAGRITSQSAASEVPSQTARSQPPSRLSVRELVVELARVEESLRKLPALLVRRDALIPNPARRPLVRRERDIMGELAARRRARGARAWEPDRLPSATAVWRQPPRR